MLMAVTVVSCTTPIFLLSDNVVPFFLVPISDTYSERGKIFVRNLTGMPDFRHRQSPFTFVMVKETGKQRKPFTSRSTPPLSCTFMQGA